MRYIPDTNALIYLLDNRLAEPFPSGQYGYSVITEIELLSWPKMQPDKEQSCRELLVTMHRIELDAPIRETTITLRREHCMKLPDALIAACAIHFDAILLTNDQRLLLLPGLRCQSLELKPA
ncbi:MAG: type II toxin-antitoxin system VapC family toxin [Sulfurimicrobium sp.]|nr:type II toxin-antitoxin system VapC family toxin [Sulfurimicrobium sp.]